MFRRKIVVFVPWAASARVVAASAVAAASSAGVGRYLEHTWSRMIPDIPLIFPFVFFFSKRHDRHLHLQPHLTLFAFFTSLRIWSTFNLFWFQFWSSIRLVFKAFSDSRAAPKLIKVIIFEHLFGTLFL